MDKAEIRQTMKLMRGDLTSKYVNDNSERVFESLIELDEVKNARHVMIYSNFANEVKTGKLAGWLLFHQKQVYLPVVDGSKLLIANMKSTCLEMNCFGIAQPEKASACFVQPSEIDLFIVPGLAFDMQCNRIGFGKGYYDGLLSQAKDNVKIGLAYDFQIVDKIGVEEQDIKMDMVVTPQSVIMISRD
jgi:5-formyltetrahydrofolate cyclo-ligase